MPDQNQHFKLSKLVLVNLYEYALS